MGKKASHAHWGVNHDQTKACTGITLLLVQHCACVAERPPPWPSLVYRQQNRALGIHWAAPAVSRLQELSRQGLSPQGNHSTLEQSVSGSPAVFGA